MLLCKDLSIQELSYSVKNSLNLARRTNSNILRREIFYLHSVKKKSLWGVSFVCQQVLAALRIIVDIDLNYYDKTTSDALYLYKLYAWEDNTDLAQKDILRSQALPGFVASYVFGQMEISRVRGMAERGLGRDFNLKDFHYEVLRQGEYPLGYLEEHIRAYIACKKNPDRDECKEF